MRGFTRICIVVKGDADNARYWYQRAGQPEASDTLEAEWTRIVQHLLD